MNEKKFRKLLVKGIKGSAEKQLEVFLQSSMTERYFKEALNNSIK